ncbi:uncharacterized protein LOC119335416 isoform X3 [Triticum dicoccoides]|uniref:uncharacterized protein LOC119335416 isoform X3 n=1 Tax=Triticum dicoccoides TaxID=85692 RepID=UPI001891556A|nr:uncharacterized protein LOC119335416 isoform X3 [Triticum dicoccoides]
MASASPSPDSTTVSDHHRKVVASLPPPPSPDIGERPTHARFLVSDAEAGLLIGKAGSAVRAVEARSGARIMFSAQGQHLPGTECRVLLVSGLFRTVMDAAELILEKLVCHCQGDSVTDGGAQASVVLVVPDACCGALIGKGGQVIKSLAQESNAGINISPRDICYGQHDRLVTITGQLDNQLQAIFFILSELLDVIHYSCSDAGVNFSSYPVSPVGCEDGYVKRYNSKPTTSPRSSVNNSDEQESLTITVADKHVGAIVGRAGRTIKEIEQVTGAFIRISGKGDIIHGTNDSRKVVIRGTLEALNAAEAMIMQLVCDTGRQLDGGDRKPLEQPNTSMRSPDNSNDTSVPDKHVSTVIGQAGTHHDRLSDAELEKFGPYFPHLVDKFIDAIAKDVKEKSNDDMDYKRGYQQQTIEYANSALKRYNCANNKTAGDYELVEAICSCGIMDTKGVYGHANFTARNNSNSKVDFFFAELFWDSKKDSLVTTCVVSLEEEERVGGFRGMEGINYRDGMNIRVDPQHCYACRADLKHPVDGGLYEIGHKAMSECYGYDS